MAADKMMACFNGLGRMAKLEYQVCIQCAPVLMGEKVSNIVTVKKNLWKAVKAAVRGTGVTCVPLYIGRRSDVLMLYRRPLLEVHLQNQEVQSFLKSFGYDHMDIPSVLLNLRYRYQEYERGMSFPHELGAVLGYPTKDVEGFILHDGKDYLLSGPWKVYDNPDEARAIFRLYDQLRKYAVKQILEGRTLKEIVKQYSSSSGLV